jgi:hypothetical protein
MFPQIPSQLPSMLWCYGVLLLLFLEPLVGGQLVFDNQIEGNNAERKKEGAAHEDWPRLSPPRRSLLLTLLAGFCYILFRV